MYFGRKISTYKIFKNNPKVFWKSADTYHVSRRKVGLVANDKQKGKNMGRVKDLIIKNEDLKKKLEGEGVVSPYPGWPNCPTVEEIVEENEYFQDLLRERHAVRCNHGK